jgi:hypothetical protein
MNLTPEALQDETRYRLVEELEHTQLIPFVQKYMYRFNAVSAFFWSANVAILVVLAMQVGKDFARDTFDFAIIASSISFGILATFAIGIVIHENIHFVAYKAVGAQQASVQYEWRNMIFLCTADKFVANSREFFWVAILPFLLINTALIVPLFFSTGGWFYFFGGALLMHTGACSGDFALLSFLYEHRRQEIYTFDDMSENKSYFYAKIQKTM